MNIILWERNDKYMSTFKLVYRLISYEDYCKQKMVDPNDDKSYNDYISNLIYDTFNTASTNKIVGNLDMQSIIQAFITIRKTIMSQDLDQITMSSESICEMIRFIIKVLGIKQPDDNVITVDAEPIETEIAKTD